jgi:hypothetical protein
MSARDPSRSAEKATSVPSLPAGGRKFGNIPTDVDGYTFDSKKEARRYGELKLLARAGRIADLQIHPRFPLDVNGHPICRYEGDFAYTEDGARVVEDVKSAITRKHPVYRLKAKLFRALMGFEIREV